MTTTAAPPTDEVLDQPGVTRRHRPSDLYHERTNFQFIKHSRRWLMLSGSFMILAILLLFVRGLNLGIDFKGGTSWQLDAKIANPTVGDVRSVISPLGFNDAKVSILTANSLSTNKNAKSIRVEAKVVDDPIGKVEKVLAKYAGQQQAAVQFKQDGAGGSFAVTTAKSITPKKDNVAALLKGTALQSPKVDVAGQNITVTVAKTPASPVETVAAALAKYAHTTADSVNIDTVGPTWGRDVSRNAIKALIFFFLLLALYLAVRFEWKMSVAAIIAVIHDIIFTVGVYALFHFQVSPATITAFLTILGFSLYDTVVVFDKVLEFQKTMTATGRATYSEMVNRALNAVLMRSLSTSLVALLPVLSLLIVGSGIFGATALEDFALALAAGLFIGSYSSIFVASPILAWWKEKEPQNRALAERRRRIRPQMATVGATSAPAAAAAYPDTDVIASDRDNTGVPGPRAVPRTPIQARPRQQRGKKRR